MSVYGLTDQGFNKKTYTIIRQEMVDDAISRFGPSIDTTDDTVFGQILSLIAYYQSEGWDIDEAIWQSFSPSNATGEALSRLVELNGIERLAATYSTDTITINGTPGTIVIAGFTINVQGTSNSFATTDDVTISDNGTVQAQTECIVTGPIAAPAGTLTVIQTPVFGVISVSNDNNAVLGTNIETDQALRARRIAAITLGGTATPDALYSAVVTTLGVTQCIVIYNEESVPDADGRPPNCFEVVAVGGEAVDLASTIWKNKPAGIPSYGNTMQTHVDTQGITRKIYFSRPPEEDIYITVYVHTNTNFPLDGQDQIAQALINFGATFMIGQCVYQTQLYGYIHKVAGVLHVQNLFLDVNPNPTSGNDLIIPDDAIAKFDIDRIQVILV